MSKKPAGFEREPYLVQRLQRPFPNQPAPADGPFVGAGLSKNASEILGALCRLDYMGASEFEWGAVPQSLNRMVSTHQGNMCFGTHTVKVKKPHAWSGSLGDICASEWNSYPTEVIVPVHFIAPKDIFRSCVEWVRQNPARNEYIQTKETVRFMPAAYLLGTTGKPGWPKEKEYQHYVGWLDIHNDWFFFIDETMFEGAKKMFGVAEEMPKPRREFP